MKPANQGLSGLGTTIFEVMSRLAEKHQSINLGQGFPDDQGPDDVREVAARELTDGWNQYPSALGIPELRQAVAAHDKRFYGIDADWATETLVTSGATEALASALFGLLEPGDEIVLFQPMYDSYLPIIRRAGAIPRLVNLEPPNWTFTEAQLAEVFNERTKAVLINDPLNPAGKVFRREELELLASFVTRFDTYAICDEVYEHLVFDGLEHIPLITLPGMRDRCVKIGSAGKTFSLTGWKVGYLTGAPGVIGPIAKAHQFLTYTTPPNLQHAVAHGLGKSDDYFTGLSSDMAVKRDRLADGLRSIGFEVHPSEGTYFLTMGIDSTGFEGDDVAFCQHLTENVGVTAVPVSAFYDSDPVTNVVRFCFCKKFETIDGALERLVAAYGAGVE